MNKELLEILTPEQLEDIQNKLYRKTLKAIESIDIDKKVNLAVTNIINTSLVEAFKGYDYEELAESILAEDHFYDCIIERIEFHDVGKAITAKLISSLS